MRLMLVVRKMLVSLFALLLLLALVGGVVSISLNKAFSSPANIENWLAQSKLYNHFVTNVIDQTEAITTITGQATVSSNDQAVRQATQATFSQQLISQSVNTFLDSNYAWLQGKTATPDFKIDLSSQKNALAKQIGQSVAAHLSQLPDCSAQQISQMQSIDLLTLNCKPPGVDPDNAAADVQQQIASSSSFLSNPVITASNLNPQGASSTKQPYYKQLSMLPKLYQLGQKLPAAFAGIAVLSLVILLVAAPSKRLALRLIAKLLLTAAVLLAVTRLAFDIVFNKLQSHVFSQSSDGQLQQSLTDFTHRAIKYVTHIELQGSLVYLIVALCIMAILLIQRLLKRRPARATSPVLAPQLPIQQDPPVPESTVIQNSAKTTKKKRPVMDVVGKPTIAPQKPNPAPKQSARSKFRPHGLGRRGSIQ